MNIRTASWVLLMALLAPLTAIAQWNGAFALEVAPPHPTTADSIEIHTVVSAAGRNLCDFALPLAPNVTRNGGAILVEYAVRERTPADPVPATCLATLHPVPVYVELGRLPAGQYELTLAGTTAGQQNPAQTIAFNVSPSPSGTPAISPYAVPANSSWALSMMAALMLGLAALRLRSH
jgi:hypothetical protein